jgi:hypothetical protein
MRAMALSLSRDCLTANLRSMHDPQDVDDFLFGSVKRKRAQRQFRASLPCDQAGRETGSVSATVLRRTGSYCEMSQGRLALPPVCVNGLKIVRCRGPSEHASIPEYPLNHRIHLLFFNSRPAI